MSDQILPNFSKQIDLLFNITAVAAMLWLALTLFILWRRWQANLTPVDVPTANPDAQPDFLSVDHKKQKAARKRGDDYDKQLSRRERIESATQVARSAGLFQRVFGYAALLLSIVSLLTVLAGSFWPESFAGKLLSHFSNEGRLLEVVQAHPVALSIAIVAVVLCLFRVFLPRTGAVNA